MTQIKMHPMTPADMGMRRVVARGIMEVVSDWKLNQIEVAARLGTSKTFTNKLVNGRVDQISLSTLINIAVSLDIHIHITVSGTCRNEPQEGV